LSVSWSGKREAAFVSFPTQANESHLAIGKQMSRKTMS
jgi:hypothetical protein